MWTHDLDFYYTIADPSDGSVFILEIVLRLNLSHHTVPEV